MGHTSCHHELAKDEIWIGNIWGTQIPEHYRVLKTIRLGEQAYCIKGTPLPVDQYRPLIVNKSEEMAVDKIQMDRIANAANKYR